VLLVGLDWTVEAAITAEPFGYSRQQLVGGPPRPGPVSDLSSTFPRQQLVGGSLLRLMHPEEHLALVQTTQALVAITSE